MRLCTSSYMYVLAQSVTSPRHIDNTAKSMVSTTLKHKTKKKRTIKIRLFGVVMTLITKEKYIIDRTNYRIRSDFGAKD